MPIELLLNEVTMSRFVMPPPLKNWPVLKTGFDRLLVLYLSFLLIWLLFRLFLFDRFFPLAMLNLVALYLLMPLAIALPWVLWQRRWRLLAGFTIPLVFALHEFAPLFLPSFSPVPTAGIPLKVMSFNVLWGNRDFDAIAQVIRTESPDIIGFQELSSQHMPELVARLGQDYPYSAVHPDNDGHTVGFLSRVAIETDTEGRTIPPEPLANPPVQRGIKVHFKIQNQPLILLVTHLSPPLSPTAVFREGVGRWVAVSRQHHLERRAQVQEIQAIATQASEGFDGQPQSPLVMLCDCNMTSTTQTYRELSTVLSDSFAERGWGLGHTFLAATEGIAKHLPMQRLDYVWHNTRVITHKAHVGVEGASDHLPLIATVIILRD